MKGTQKFLFISKNPYGVIRVASVLGPSHYLLRTCNDNRRVAAVIHANRLKPFHDPNDMPVDIPADFDDHDEPCLCEDEFPEGSFELQSTPNSDSHQITQPRAVEQHTQLEPQDDDIAEQTDSAEGDPIQLHETEPIFRAEKILKKRKKRSRWQHLVKWANCPDVTWEPGSNILDDSLIDEFEKSTRQ